MHDVQFAPDVVRSYAKKIVIVLTDGNSRHMETTKKMAEETRADGITVFVIGVGTKVKDEELINIAGNSAMVTKVKSYDQLSSILHTLASKTCIREWLGETGSERKKPTTTPLPKTETCGERNPTDVNFVFSPATLGLNDTAWATTFISHTISAKDLDVGFRQLVDVGFSEQRGGRLKASKVAVIVASGGSEEAEEELGEYVAELTASGVRVYIADPSGSGISVTGAVTLAGRSSMVQAYSLVSELCPKLCAP